MTIILIIIALLLLTKGGGNLISGLGKQISQVTGAPGSATIPASNPVPSAINNAVPPPASQGGSNLNAQFEEEKGLVQSTQALNAVPVIGPALAAAAQFIGNWLVGNSEKRAQAAQTENQAVANFIPAMDQALELIAQKYNSGEIDANGAIQLTQTLWANYWAEVTPKIQPGRNGCKGGALIGPQGQGPKGVNTCGGSWGAACCNGPVIGTSLFGDGVATATVGFVGAINQNQSTGKPATATILKVFASKYGGVNRAQYTITLSSPLLSTPAATSTGGWAALL